MENRDFRKFEWSVWKLLDWRILHQIPKGFWEPWATPKPPAVSNEPPTENFCLRAWNVIFVINSTRILDMAAYIIIQYFIQVFQNWYTLTMHQINVKARTNKRLSVNYLHLLSKFLVLEGDKYNLCCAQQI